MNIIEKTVVSAGVYSELNEAVKDKTVGIEWLRNLTFQEYWLHSWVDSFQVEQIFSDEYTKEELHELKDFAEKEFNECRNTILRDN